MLLREDVLGMRLLGATRLDRRRLETPISIALAAAVGARRDIEGIGIVLKPAMGLRCRGRDGHNKAIISWLGYAEPAARVQQAQPPGRLRLSRVAPIDSDATIARTRVACVFLLLSLLLLLLLAS